MLRSLNLSPYVVAGVALAAAPAALFAARAAACPGASESFPTAAQSEAEPVEISWEHGGWSQPWSADAPASDGLVVDLRDDLGDEEIERLARDLGLPLVDTTKVAGGNLWEIDGTPEELAIAMKRLEGRSEVESVEPNVFYALDLPSADDHALPSDAPEKSDDGLRPNKPNDPLYKHQWHFDMVNAESAWARADGKGVVVAVIDTGVSEGKIDGKATKYKRVPDLNATEFVPGWNFVDNKRDASDGNGHGTHVAGTIAQSTNNAFGVAGLAPKAKIMPVKVLSDRGSGTLSAVANGIRFAADKGAKVINMSLGGGGHSAVLQRAVQYAHDKGVTVVCATGNAARGRVEYPAAYPGCVGVSAIGPDGKLAFYSSYGKETDISAPGGDTRVDLNNDGIPDGVLQDTIARGDPSKHGFFPFMGTSMATPHVAGVAALIVSQGVTDPDRVEEILKGTAQDKGDKLRFGAGALDAAAAVKKATRDHALWSLGIASLLGGLAFSRSRKKDGLLRAKGGVGLAAGVLVGASGLFFLKELGLGLVPGLEVLAAPAGEWTSELFGFSALNPVVGSAALALVPMALLLGVKKLRPALAGFAFGVAGFLVARGVLGSVDVAWIPGHGLLDAMWLLGNGAVAALLGRLALRD